MSLDIPERVHDRIERLLKKSGSESMTEVIRRSLAVYEALLDVTINEHAKVVVRSSNGKEKEILLIPDS